MISHLISYMIYRFREEKHKPEQRTVMHTINIPARTAKGCLDVHLLKPALLHILPGQPDSDVVCADGCSSIRFANPIRLSAG